MDSRAPHAAVGLVSGFALIVSLPSALAQQTDRPDAVSVAVGGALSPSYTGSDEYRIKRHSLREVREATWATLAR